MSRECALSVLGLGCWVAFWLFFPFPFPFWPISKMQSFRRGVDARSLDSPSLRTDTPTHECTPLSNEVTFLLIHSHSRKSSHELWLKEGRLLALMALRGFGDRFSRGSEIARRPAPAPLPGHWRGRNTIQRSSHSPSSRAVSLGPAAHSRPASWMSVPGEPKFRNGRTLRKKLGLRRASTHTNIRIVVGFF